MLLEAMWARTLPGKRLDENLAGMTPRILRGTGDHTINPMLESWKKSGPASMLPSYRKPLICGAIGLYFAGLYVAAPLRGQATIEPRSKPAAKVELLPKANIRVDTTLVLIPVTVTDPMNRFVTGLEKENFRVFEDKVEQEVKQFSSEDAPLSVGVVFDCSGSMGHKLEKSRLAVAQF